MEKICIAFKKDMFSLDNTLISGSISEIEAGFTWLQGWAPVTGYRLVKIVKKI